MAIIYTCPMCGADLQDIVMTSYPPQAAKKCVKCGWEYVYKDGGENDVRVPFVPPEFKEYTMPSDNNSVLDPCKGCSNHPSNGGSGICNCCVPYMSPNSPYRINCGG